MVVGQLASLSLALAAAVYGWSVVQNDTKVMFFVYFLVVDRKKIYELKKRMNKCMNYDMSLPS